MNARHTVNLNEAKDLAATVLALHFSPRLHAQASNCGSGVLRCAQDDGA
jgi:hypothetical protein